MRTGLLIALALATVAAAATCQHQRRTGELRAKEAQEEAEEWRRRAGAYAEALERAEEAHRRAEQSTRDYLRDTERAEERHGRAVEKVEEMRESGGDCGWLDERVPDGVREAIRELFPGAGCD